MTDREKVQKIAEIEKRNARRTQGSWAWLTISEGPLLVSMKDGIIDSRIKIGPGPDGDFIINAPTDIEFLLNEVKQLRAQLAKPGK